MATIAAAFQRVRDAQLELLIDKWRFDRDPSVVIANESAYVDGHDAGQQACADDLAELLSAEPAP